jgi:predicted DNA-binding protein
VPKPKATPKRGRPKLDKETFSVRLSAETKGKLDKAMEQTSRGFSDYIELALKDRFKKDGIE